MEINKTQAHWSRAPSQCACNVPSYKCQICPSKKKSGWWPTDELNSFSAREAERFRSLAIQKPIYLEICSFATNRAMIIYYIGWGKKGRLMRDVFAFAISREATCDCRCWEMYGSGMDGPGMHQDTVSIPILHSKTIVGRTKTLLNGQQHSSSRITARIQWFPEHEARRCIRSGSYRPTVILYSSPPSMID